MLRPCFGQAQAALTDKTITLLIMLKRIIIFIIVFAFLYRLYRRFIAPFFRMSAAAHDRINDIKKQMDQMQQQQNTAFKEQQKKQVDGEYIEYEELK